MLSTFDLREKCYHTSYWNMDLRSTKNSSLMGSLNAFISSLALHTKYSLSIRVLSVFVRLYIFKDSSASEVSRQNLVNGGSLGTDVWFQGQSKHHQHDLAVRSSYLSQKQRLFCFVFFCCCCFSSLFFI